MNFNDPQKMAVNEFRNPGNLERLDVIEADFLKFPPFISNIQQVLSDETMKCIVLYLSDQTMKCIVLYCLTKQLFIGKSDRYDSFQLQELCRRQVRLYAPFPLSRM